MQERLARFACRQGRWPEQDTRSAAGVSCFGAFDRGGASTGGGQHQQRQHHCGQDRVQPHPHQQRDDRCAQHETHQSHQSTSREGRSGRTDAPGSGLAPIQCPFHIRKQQLQRGIVCLPVVGLQFGGFNPPAAAPVVDDGCPEIRQETCPLQPGRAECVHAGSGPQRVRPVGWIARDTHAMTLPHRGGTGRTATNREPAVVDLLLGLGYTGTDR